MLHKFSFDGAKPVSTPFAYGMQPSTTDGIPLADPTIYREMAGSLQYLTFTRPDIALINLSSIVYASLCEASHLSQQWWESTMVVKPSFLSHKL